MAKEYQSYVGGSKEEDNAYNDLISTKKDQMKRHVWSKEQMNDLQVYEEIKSKGGVGGGGVSNPIVNHAMHRSKAIGENRTRKTEKKIIWQRNRELFTFKITYEKPNQPQKM